MRRLVLVLCLMPSSLLAGTGSTNDVELAYLYFVLFMGIILLFLEGKDRISKNKHRILNYFMAIASRIACFIQRFRRKFEVHYFLS